jgi:hypothetical protein
MRACINGLNSKADAIWECQDFCPEQMSVEKLGMELKVFRFHVGKNDNIVLIQ